ncbi:hypothetical protein V5799_025366 [Amblyomma americanum]|uniref:Uncharacterized protein n=1 Tax=Amblyomma americanum TaxID=6943 RepID=A0AAQ4E9G2_AMBAM
MRVRSLPATASRPPSCIFCVAPLRCLSSGSCQLSRWFATADVEASRRWLGRCRLFNLKLTATIRTFVSWVQQKRRIGNFLLGTGTTYRQEKELRSPPRPSSEAWQRRGPSLETGMAFHLLSSCLFAPGLRKCLLESSMGTLVAHIYITSTGSI